MLASGIATADEVTDWNQIMLAAMLTPPVTPAPVATRTAAIFQSAVFDAANGIDPHYKPIYVRPAAPRGASMRASVVQAAYAILLNLYPDQKFSLDQHRKDSLAAITDASEAIQAGLIWGQYVADEIWGWRSHDGFSAVIPTYQGGTDPGQWRPTPHAMAAGLVPQLAQVTPWVLQSPSQFHPAGPAALNSDQYTADFNETKSMGGATNSGRTPDATLYTSFWQPGNPPDYWDPVVISLASEHRLSMVDTAQTLALVNMGIADSHRGLFGREVYVQFLAPGYRDPVGRHRWE